MTGSGKHNTRNSVNGPADGNTGASTETAAGLPAQLHVRRSGARGVTQSTLYPPRWRCAGEHLAAPHAAPRLRSGRPELVEGRKLAFRLGTLPPARRPGADSRRRRSGAIGPTVVIRAPA